MNQIIPSIYSSHDESEKFDDYDQPIPVCLKQYQINLDPHIIQNPFSIFLELFTEDIWEFICKESNAYYERCVNDKNHIGKLDNRWVNFSINELKAFIGVLLLMGLNSRPGLYDHWSSSIFLKSIVSEIIPQNLLVQKYSRILRQMGTSTKESLEGN